jgi:hypothetical protein
MTRARKGIYEYVWPSPADAALGPYRVAVALNTGNVVSSKLLSPAFTVIGGI